MKHLTEEEMIEHHYGEDLLKADVERHLRECKQCAEAYEGLERLLGSIHSPEIPARGPEYGAQVWQSIRGSLLPYEPRKKRGFFSWPQLAYAAAGLVLLALAFVAGRIWEHTNQGPSLAGNPQETKERVVLFVLDKHLDRSARLLVQLSHSDGGDERMVDQPLQAEARELLIDNRLYRQSVNRADDPLLAAALDHLERVLLELSNSPDGLNTADIARIEKEMNTQGLLFQIRVLHSKVSEQQANARAAGKGAIL